LGIDRERFFSKKFTFCLDTKSNKKIKAKQIGPEMAETLLVLPRRHTIFFAGCDLLSNYHVA
jgi:hypothetical protein